MKDIAVMKNVDKKSGEEYCFKQFYIAMTNRCNLQCIMCATTRHDHTKEGELSLEQWELIINNITRFKVDSIGFGGGEPLLRRDLAGLIRIVSAKGIMVNIITNATLLNQSFLERLAGHKKKIVFLLSLDGLEKDNDGIRGRGVFKKVMEAASLLKKYDWTFYFTSVLMPENFFGYIDFLKFIIQKYPGVFMDIQPVIPHNEIYYRRNKFKLDKAQADALNNIIIFLGDSKNKLNLCRPLEVICQYKDYFIGSLRSANQCKMGTASFNINLRGNIWVCGKELDYPLYEYKLEDVLGSREYLTEMARVKNCNSPCLAGLVI
ncbi:MAG: radical SAM protein [Candidatus Omnitrophota bacterium]